MPPTVGGPITDRLGPQLIHRGHCDQWVVHVATPSKRMPSPGKSLQFVAGRVTRPSNDPYEALNYQY